MKMQTTQKTFLGLLCVITTAVLCALPFFTIKTDTIYVYSRDIVLDSREQGFVRELKNLGYRVKLNSQTLPTPDSVGFWFKSPASVSEISKSPAKYNFIYNEDYYPFEWRGLSKTPVVLTPYRDLYEHYSRYNIKTAMFTLGVNMEDFHASSSAKRYTVIYYGDNTNSSPLAETLKQNKTQCHASGINPKTCQDLERMGKSVRFLGKFWEDNERLLKPQNGAKEKGRELRQTMFVAMYNAPQIPNSKIVPVEVMEATASGALVITSPNSAIKNIYGDNVVEYDYSNIAEDFTSKIIHYAKQKDIFNQKVIKAQKITSEKLSSSASARRFKELLDWLKNNNSMLQDN